MKCLPVVFTFIILLSFFYTKSQGQAHKETVENFSPHSSIGIVLGHANVFDGRDADGKKIVLSLPSWGIDYNYYFHPKWAIGLHTDIILEKFIVGGEEGKKIERSRPLAPAIMGIYKPGEHWNFLLGVGEEFAKESNLFLNRFGVEYTAEIHNAWEIAGSLNYDLKWKAYDTWVIGIGISKSFGGNKKRSVNKPE